MKKETAGRRAFAPVMFGTTILLATALCVVLLRWRDRVLYATNGLPHATVSVWNITGPIGFNPDVSVEDLTGLTGHVATAANPLSIAVAIDNSRNPEGPCGLIIWNPATSVFKDYGVTGGFSAGVDINRKAPVLTGPAGTVFGAPTFQPGDIWVTVMFNESTPLYVNFKGSNNFRHYSVGAGNVRGLKVDQSTGKVYFSDDAAGTISRLDPTTNAVTTWVVGGHPHYLAIDSAGKVYSAVGLAGVAGRVDAIVRIDPATNTVTSWAIPGGGLSSVFEEVALDGLNFDDAGNLWFALSVSNKIGRLNPGTNAICEFSKIEVMHPQQVASSGSGRLLQTFFTEEGSSTDLKGAVSIVTQAEAVPITSPCPIATPGVSTVTPSTSTASFFDKIRTPRLNTITPLVVDVPGQDGTSASGTTKTADGIPIPGILRFPMPTPSGGNPAARNFPSGMTGVVSSNSVAGSYQDKIPSAGNSAVFLVKSGAIIAPPPSQVTVQQLKLTPANNSGTVFNDNNSNATSVTLNGLTQNATVTVSFSLVDPSAGFLQLRTGDPPCIIVSSDGTKCAVQEITANTTAYKSAHLYHGWIRKGTKNPHLFKTHDGITEDITTGQYIEPGVCGDTFPLSTYRDIELPLPTGAINCGFFRPVADGAVFNLGRDIPFRFEATTSTCGGGPFITAASGAQPRLSLAKVVPRRPPVPQPVMPSGASNVSNLFRIGDGRVWKYNASTKHLTAGDYIVTVFDLTNHIPPASVRISLR